MLDWQEISQSLSHSLNRDISLRTPSSVRGGCINQAWKTHDQNGELYFIKSNTPSRLSMFEAEAEGLQAIENSQAIRSPKVFTTQQQATASYIVMEYIAMQSCSNMILLGQQLAAMHKQKRSRFGWHRDNTIGATPQSNQQHQDWVTFWCKERLVFQLNLAKHNGLSNKQYEDGLKLANNVSVFFDSYSPVASLLHGDLWGGNCSQDLTGNPVIYDPAVYFGDRETDLAMMELFGGFSSSCFDSYAEHYPIDEGYSTRKTLYNLYHILNHFNLFGGGYGTQAHGMIHRLLAEL
ncbi:MAG: Unknown protein [uncultured Thiotrichaceae bacterium]|uniref:Ribulosamine/erythrulosamine 3-kinase potentially involved in protein deglycation n=1 Tax=uncultured Thiotrichaceae bacterium TaxID=298394 RepID=A0A6S6TNL1_9GAMM|nr:MAG: Unknown protein [uncultured Thiotrichaceae bacterium]